jgi:hypothetical protein
MDSKEIGRDDVNSIHGSQDMMQFLSQRIMF